MRNHKIATRYAKALFQSALERNELEKIYKQFNSVLTLIRESEELAYFLKHPIIGKDKQKVILEKVFKSELAPSLMNFLIFLTEKERLEFTEDIGLHFEELYAEHEGVLDAKLTSFYPLHTEQIEKISQKLKKHFKKEINIHTELDKALLGGFKVQIGDLIYDFSIRTQLERFRQSVMKA